MAGIRAFSASFIFPAIFLLSFQLPAAAENCKSLQRYTSVDLVRSDGGGAAFVPVTMEGQEKLLLLDTGGFFSEVTPEIVKELGLRTKLSTTFTQIDVARRESDHAAIVTDFKIGRVPWKSVDFMIMPGEHPFGKDADPRLAGVLGPNILKAYDVDLDFGANKLSLMSPDHCEGKVIYWPATAVAVIPMWINGSWHITVPVTLDGVPLNAMIDTGASRSTLMLNKAEARFGIKPGSADTPDIGPLAGRKGARMYRHRFHALSFDGIAVTNLDMDLIPDLLKPLLSTGRALDSHLPAQDAREFPDLLIGMDVLRHLHIYIAYKEKKLYITPAAPAPAQASTAAAQPAATAH